MPASILSHALILTFVNLLLRGISLLFQMWLSRTIGANGLGLMQLLFTVGGFAMTVALSGARVASMYLCSEEYGNGRLGGVRCAMRVSLLYGFSTSFFVAAALAGFSPLIASQILHNSAAARPLCYLALFLPFDCLGAIFGGFFTACKKIRRLVSVQFCERLLSLGFTFLLLLSVKQGETVRACSALILGGGFASVLSVAALFYLYLRTVQRFGRAAKDTTMHSRLLKLTIPLALGDYLRSGLTCLEQLLIPWGLRQFAGSAESSLAAYGTIHGMTFPLLMLPAGLLFSLSDLLVPELARCRAAKRFSRIETLCGRCLRLGLSYAVFSAGVIWLLSDSLGTLIYHSAEVGRYLRVFALIIPVLYLDALVDGMNKGLGQQVACVRYNSFTAALDIMLLFLLLPRYGIAAYVGSFYAVHAVNFYLSFGRLHDMTGFWPDFWRIASFAVCTAASVFAASVPYGNGILYTVLQFLIYSGSFLLFARLFRLVQTDDLLALRKALSKPRNPGETTCSFTGEDL